MFQILQPPTDKQVSACRQSSSATFGGRRATATIELVVCLPMMMLLVFGSIQLCDLIFLQQTVVSAAYEGTIELARPNASTASVVNRVEQVLTMHDVKGFEVKVLPEGTEVGDLATGTPVQIEVSADVDTNLAVDGWFPTNDRAVHTAVGPR